MLDPIVNFFTWIFQWIGRGIGLVIGIILWPFMWAGRWYAQRGWILKAVLGVAIVGLLGLYAYFFWTTQVLDELQSRLCRELQFRRRARSRPASSWRPAPAPSTAKTCGRSGIADVAADLTDFNVNQNAWVSSMILYKLGLFGMPGTTRRSSTTRPSFQRGINQAVRRTATELVDNLGRVRGTSQIDPDLQDARGNIAVRRIHLVFRHQSVRPEDADARATTVRRSRNLRTFNDRLQACNAVFDARADNLIQFIDRVANDIGSTSAILKDRAENYNDGWFDTRADDRFWFAYGQLYGYYGMMSAAHADFEDVHQGKAPRQSVGHDGSSSSRRRCSIQPFIIANGREDGWIMPTHLTTMGFYILRVRSNLVEIRNVLTQ